MISAERDGIKRAPLLAPQNSQPAPFRVEACAFCSDVCSDVCRYKTRTLLFKSVQVLNFGAPAKALALFRRVIVFNPPLGGENGKKNNGAPVVVSCFDASRLCRLPWDRIESVSTCTPCSMHVVARLVTPKSRLPRRCGEALGSRRRAFHHSPSKVVTAHLGGCPFWAHTGPLNAPISPLRPSKCCSSLCGTLDQRVDASGGVRRLAPESDVRPRS